MICGACGIREATQRAIEINRDGSVGRIALYCDDCLTPSRKELLGSRWRYSGMKDE